MMPTKRVKELTKEPFETEDIRGDDWELVD